MEITYEEFLNVLTYNKRHEYKCVNIMHHAEKVFDKENVLFFYPKAIFVEDKENEFIFIVKENIISLREPKSVLNANVRKLKDIEEITIINDGEYDHDTIMTLRFNDGHKLVFSTTEDSNDYWKPKYKKLIIDIYKHLIIGA